MNDSNLGFPDKPDPDESTLAQQPIYLPAPQEQQAYVQPQQQFPYSQWVPPQGMGSRPLPMNPAAGTNRSWKNDPAYRVLFIAIGVVLLSSLTCFTVLAAMFSQPSSQTSQRGGPNTQQTAGGANISSPTPTATPTPTPVPTPTPAPTPTPVIGPLTVEITNIPRQVTDGRNGTTVPVDVTSAPGVTVFLSVTYTFNGVTFSSIQTQPETTDNQGNATITWNVQAFFRGATVTAQVTAVAQDQQDNQVKSTTVKVTINSN